MGSRQYIKVKALGGGSDPDPAVFCPVNGYIPDPTVYVPDEVVEDMPDPGDDEIILICSDQGDRHVAFAAQTSSGQYNVKVYGDDDVLLFEQSSNSGYTFQYDFPLGSGVPRAGYTTYKLVISPVTGSSHLTYFAVRTASGYPSIGWRILAAKFNTPYITNLSSAFLNNSYITYLEILGSCDHLVTVDQMASGCSSLNRFIFATSADSLSDLDYLIRNTPKLYVFELPDSLPAATTMVGMLYGTCGVLEFDMPSYLPLLQNLSSICNGNSSIRRFSFNGALPELQNLSSAFYNCSGLITLDWPTAMPKVNSLASVCRGCNELLEEQVFPEMPLVTIMSYSFHSCEKIPKLVFTGAMDVCTNIISMCTSAYSLQEVVFPTSMTGLDVSQGTLYIFNNCYNLKKIILPLAMDYINEGIETSWFYNFNSCYLLEEITTCDSWPNRLMVIQMQYLRSLLVFDQPDAKFYSINFNASGSSTHFSPLNYFNIDWSSCFSEENRTPVYSFYYSSIDITEAARIVNALPSKPATFPGQPLIMFVNCLADELETVAIFYGFLDDNPLIWKRSYGDMVSSYEVGRKLIYQNDVFTQRPATISSGIINKVGHNMPNGTEVSFREIITATGLEVNHRYYVVNTLTDSFQVAETPEGIALSLSGSGSCFYTAFPTILEIITTGTGYLRVDFQTEGEVTTNVHGNSGDYPDLMGIAIHKGWSVS